MNEKKSAVRLYIFTVVISVAVILLVCGLNGLLTEEKTDKETIKILCDAFFVTGVLVMGMGALSWASTKGAFDGLGYSISSLINVHRPSKKRMTWSKAETYEEYVERKHEKDGKKRYMHLLFVGLAMIIVAVIFLIVYYAGF